MGEKGEGEKVGRAAKGRTHERPEGEPGKINYSLKLVRVPFSSKERPRRDLEKGNLAKLAEETNPHTFIRK